MERNKTPLVSVIVPCYNQAVYLPEALESLLKQTYRNWEAVVVNDGSPDDTERVALAYAEKDSRIKYLSLENGGLSSARNKGIAASCGEFILPLDADDLIMPRYIEKAMEAFAGNPLTKLVYCQCLFFGQKTGLWETLFYKGYRRLLLGNSIFCSAVFRRSDYEQAGGYDERMRQGHEDWEFFIRLLDEESVVCQIPQPLFHYRVKECSMITMSCRKEVYDETCFYIYSKHRELYSRLFGDNIIGCLYEAERARERRKRHKNKWYRKFYHQYIRRK